MIQRTLRLYKNAYTGLPMPVWLLAGVMLINRCGTMVLPFLTLYMTRHLGFSVAQAGVVMAAFGAGALVGTFTGGKLTDRLGFYPVQFWSLLLGGVFLLGLQFVHNFYGLCVSVFCFTALGDTFRPANSTAIAHYSGADNRTRAYSLNRLAINLGWSVGGGLGGYLAGIDYSLLFWVDGLTCILAAVLLRILLPAPACPTRQRRVENATSARPEPSGPSPYRDRLFLVFIGCVALNSIVFMHLFSLAPLYFRQVLLLSEGQIGLLMSLNGLLIVLVEMALVYTVEQRGRQKLGLIALGVLLIGFSYFTLTLSSWPGIALIATLLITIGEMLSMPFMQAFVVERSTPETRGQYLALHSMAWAFSQVTAPTLGSQVVARAGFQALWSGLMALSLMSAGGLWWLGRKNEYPPS